MIRELEIHDIVFRASLRSFFAERDPVRIVQKFALMGRAWDAWQASRETRQCHCEKTRPT